MVEIIPLAQVASASVEALLDAAFGPDRFARTAYKLRSGTRTIPCLSFAAVSGPDLLGTIQCWPVALMDADGAKVAPLIMVGPVAVAPDSQQRGLGKALMQAMLIAADGCADGALMMIGDPEYYERFFGFSASATGQWTLPGPYEERRLLARAAAGHDVPDHSGMIGPDPARDRCIGSA